VSEQTSTAVAGEQNEQGQEASKEFTAITSQADFDTAIQARIARERAKIPADYDELKANAAKFTEWQESQKTEAQKQTDRTTELERENAELKSSKALAEVAATKGVPTDLIAGPASNSPEDVAKFADALIAFRGEQSHGPKSEALARVNQSAVGNSDERAVARSLFGDN
jgi:hypothetical protein